MADQAAKNDIARADRAKSARAVWDSHYQEIHDYLFPLMSNFVRADVPGAKEHQKVLDNTGENSGEILAGALLAMMVSPDRQWFSLRAAEAALNGRDEEASWLADSTRRMLGVFNRPLSGFYTTQYAKYLDLVHYGTGGQFIAHRPGIGPRFLGRPLNQLYLMENADGVVDTVFRRYNMTARAALQAFGGSLGENIVKAANDPKKADDEFEFLHVVEPRTNRDSTRLDPRNMAFRSATVQVDQQHSIRESGFEEMPYITPRWFTRAGEAYGRGPGMKALADVKMLQRSMKVSIRGNELVMSPPLQVADDGVLAPLRMTSLGINYVRPDLLNTPGGGIRPITTGARPEVGDVFMDQIRTRIDNAYYKPLLQLARDPRMTASQFLGLMQEAMQVLSPFLGRLQTEDLGPTIDRTFAIMLRAGMFLPVPQGLAEAEIEVEYLSPVARAQQIEEARGVSSSLELLAPLIQLRPNLLDNFDLDATTRRVADTLNWPRDTFRSIEMVQRMRQAANEAAEQQSALEQAGALAQAAGRAAPILQAIQGGRAPEREAA